MGTHMSLGFCSDSVTAPLMHDDAVFPNQDVHAQLSTLVFLSCFAPMFSFIHSKQSAGLTWNMQWKYS